MTLLQLLDLLREREIVVRVEDGDLAVRAPRGAMTADIMDQLRAQKPALVDHLSSQGDAEAPHTAPLRITPAHLPLVTLKQEEIDGIVSSVPGGVANVQDIYPLAPLQEGILFHHLLEGETGGDTYLLRSIVAFDDRARMEAFIDALQKVIDRHDILRSALHWEGLPQPVQVVQRRAPLPVRVVAVDEGTDAMEALQAASDPQRVRIDLRRAPLLAANVAEDRVGGGMLMALLSHHAVCDHVAMSLVMGEIELLLKGQADRLPVPQPYRNFIARTHAMPESGHEAFFRAQLGDVEVPTAPFGVLSVQGEPKAVTKTGLRFEDSVSRRIREAARRCSVPAAVLFHVAWAHVLARCSGRDDVVFGTVLTGRLQGSEAADQVVGMFLNTLPIRIGSFDVPVADAVRATWRALSDLLAHEQASLALAQRCSAVEPPLPLFTALLNYRHSYGADTAEEAAAGTDSAWSGIRMVQGETRNNYPLTMSVEDYGLRFGLTALSVAGIDGSRMVRYMETAMTALVASLEAGGSAPLSSLPILPAEERGQVLVGFQSSRPDWSHDRTAHALFEARARTHPDAEAVRHDGVSLSYAELDARANRLAHRLIALGVGPDDRVA
ncbi:condensation domain-containing protein, partial [Marilutibacter chinensis]